MSKPENNGATILAALILIAIAVIGFTIVTYLAWNHGAIDIVAALGGNIERISFGDAAWLNLIAFVTKALFTTSVKVNP